MNMFPIFSIRSNSSDRELKFLEPRPNYFTIQLQGSSVTAKRKVYAYTDGGGLSRLFSKLAACERPWSSTENWTSLEGEFALSAQCSALGHVSLTILISDLSGAPEKWSVSVTLTTELGQLPKIAADASTFFSIVDGTKHDG